ncbi:MAG: LPS-assembly protein LptD [Deltaproteobacteria bacterium]|nr:LPS-assembly protein LptD [Deltaproteobacteria bacterium]
MWRSFRPFQDGLVRRIFLLWIACVVCLVSTDLRAESRKEGERVAIDADSFHFDQERKLFVALGNVHFQSGSMNMTCDYAEYSDETGEYTAVGNVVFKDDEGTVLCERVEGNVLTHQAKFYRAVLDNVVKEYLLKGDRIDKVGEETYRVTKGSISECGKTHPLWEIGGRHMLIEKGEYVRVKHMTLRIGGVPLFYSPYFLYPLKTTRQSGFLPPLIGEGGRNGSSVKLDYFQAIDTNRDATLTYEYLADNGNRFGLEYRYALSQKIRGAFFGRYIHDRNADREGSRIGMNEDRWETGWTHYHNLDDRLYGGIFMDVFSDGFYPSDFSPSSEARVRNNGQSDLTVVRRWDGANATADFRYYQELGTRHKTTSLQSLPELRYDIPARRAGRSNWFYSLDTSFINFYRKDGYHTVLSDRISSDTETLQPVTSDQKANLKILKSSGFEDATALRYQGLKGGRLHLDPTLSLPLDLASFAVLTSSVGYQENLYNRGVAKDHAVDEGVLHARFDLDSRFYHDFSWGRTGTLRHIVEPKISYLYRPEKGAADIPVYDELDRIDPVNEIHFSLFNRLLTSREPDRKNGKVEGDPPADRREIATLKLDALYNRRRRADRLQTLTGEFNLNLSDLYYLEINSIYDFPEHEFASLNLDFKFHLRDLFSLQVGRRFTRRIPIDTNRPTGGGRLRTVGGNDVLSGLKNDGISFWTAHMNWTPTKAVSMGLSGYFNAREKTGDDTSFHLSYEKKCWGLSLSVDRFDDTIFNDHTGKYEINRVNEVYLYFTIKSVRLKFYENIAGIGKVL